ncbi:MAG: sigma-70 family RNA polymerase sigma factor [Bacteroidota bacterium]
MGLKDLSAKTDSELIRLHLDQQVPECFSLLYNRYIGKVYSKCISLLKDEVKAQDASQEIFVKIYLNLSKFNEKSKFSTWVYSITYNFCIDFIRRQKKAKTIFSDEMENASEDLVDEVDDRELLEMEVGRLKKVLDKIPPGDKAVLLMKYQDDLSIKDISGILNKTESAIKMKLKRAKHKAQQVYKDIFPN